MFKKFKIVIIFNSLLAIILLINSSPAWAAWEWITETAISQFTAEDIALLKATGREALDTQPDDTEVSWSNPETGNSGSIIIMNTRELEGQTCRTAVLKNKTQTLEGSARYFLCQQEGGTWKVTAPPKKKQSK